MRWNRSHAPDKKNAGRRTSGGAQPGPSAPHCLLQAGSCPALPARCPAPHGPFRAQPSARQATGLGSWPKTKNSCDLPLNLPLGLQKNSTCSSILSSPLKIHLENPNLFLSSSSVFTQRDRQYYGKTQHKPQHAAVWKHRDSSTSRRGAWYAADALRIKLTHPEAAQRAPFGYPQLDENCAATARNHSSALKASQLNCISSVLQPDRLLPSTSVSGKVKVSIHNTFWKALRASESSFACIYLICYLDSTKQRPKKLGRNCVLLYKDICCPLISYRNEKKYKNKARSRFIAITVPQYQRSDRLQRASLFFHYNTHLSVHNCCSAKEGRDGKEKALWHVTAIKNYQESWPLSYCDTHTQNHPFSWKTRKQPLLVTATHF